MQAFKTDHYKTTTLHADGSQEIHQSYRDTLSSLLITKLGKLDKKYHVDLPAILKVWTQEHEVLANGWPENGTMLDDTNGQDAGEKDDILQKAKTHYDEKELDYLRQSWTGWLTSVNDNDGERVPSAEEKRNRLRSTIRERLSALETAEYAPSSAVYFRVPG